MFRATVYIDGFNLYNGLHDAWRRQFLWLDLEALARSLLHPDQQLERVDYFTARMRQSPSRHRQDIYLQALAAHSTCLRTIEGRFQERTQYCRTCGISRRTYEEKETDVGIAVTLVEDAARDAFDTALLVSGDSDLCPAIRAAKRLQPTKRIIAVFPPQRRSDPLRAAADGVYWIGRDKVSRAQLPLKVVTSAGIVLERPAYWQP